jgi:hypothetical protein
MSLHIKYSRVPFDRIKEEKSGGVLISLVDKGYTHRLSASRYFVAFISFHRSLDNSLCLHLHRRTTKCCTKRVLSNSRHEYLSIHISLSFLSLSHFYINRRAHIFILIEIHIFRRSLPNTLSQVFQDRKVFHQVV